MNKTTVLSLISGVVFLFSGAVSANLIVNGSFEVLPENLKSRTWTTYSEIEGWKASVGKIEVRNNVAGVAQDGDVFVELDSYYNSTMYSQTVETVIGQEYTLSYFYAPRPTISANSNGIDMLFNGEVIDSYTSFSNSNDAWVERVFTVVGTGNDVVGFLADGKSDSYGGSIDNVSMVSASVPEPSLLILLSLGVIGLAGWRRKNVIS